MSDWTQFVTAGIGAMACSIVFTLIVRWISVKAGFIARARSDRWGVGDRVIALGGGLAIIGAILVALVILKTKLLILYPAIFLLLIVGFVDDVKSVSPIGKLVVQVLVAAGLVSFGLKIQPIWDVFAIPLTVCCLIGISNSYNFTDNMDGNASGIGIAIAMSIGVISAIHGLADNAQLCFVIAGALAGFLVFNRAPASVFMGDTGSLPIGLLLAIAAINQTRLAREFPMQTLAAMAPLAFLVFDTGLVAYTRQRAGRQFLQGGQDHSSHRMVRAGLSENRAVLVAVLSSLFSGVVCYFSLSQPGLTLPLLCLLFAVFFVFGLFLARVPSQYEPAVSSSGKKRDLVEYLSELGTDVLLIAGCWVFAHWFRFYDSGAGVFEDYINAVVVPLLPVVISLKIAVFYLFGVYSKPARNASDQAWRLGGASVVGSLTVVIAIFLYNRMENLSRVVVALDMGLVVITVTGLKGALRLLPFWFHGIARRETRCLWVGSPEFEKAVQACVGDFGYTYCGMIELEREESDTPVSAEQPSKLLAKIKELDIHIVVIEPGLELEEDIRGYGVDIRRLSFGLE